MKVLVVHDNGVLGRLLLNQLSHTHLEVTPLLISDLAELDLSAVEQWVPRTTDIILNAMWLTDPEAAEADPELARAKAFSLPMALAEYASANDMILVQLSTSYVFDGRKLKGLARGGPLPSAKALRIRNEIPVLFLLVIVWLVLAKPF